MDSDEIDPDLILQFCDMLGASPESANNYLKITNGNLEQAASLYLESGGEDLLSHPHNEHSEHNDVLPDLSVQGEQYREPIAPKHEVLLHPHHDIFNEFSSKYYEVASHSRHSSTAHEAAATNPNVFRDYASETAFLEGRSPDNDNKLAQLFRPPFEIMFKGDFEQALSQARIESKWLLVNLQEVSEFSCQMLNRDLWKENIVQEIIKDAFIFLQLTTQTSQGEQYRTFYPVFQFPHIAIIDPRTGERVSEWNRVLSATEFLQETTDFLDYHRLQSSSSSTRETEDKGKKNAVIDLTEDEQMNLAIAASMSDSSPHKEEVIVESPISAVKAIKALETPEPDSGPNVTRIQFRFPDGKRSIRRFRKTDPVSFLFGFVKSEESEANEKEFEVIYNRQQLANDLDKTISEAKLENASVTISFV